MLVRSPPALYIFLFTRPIVTTSRRSEDEIRLDFQQWQAKMPLESPQFQFWSKTLNLELLIVVCVQSVREGNFKLYVKSLNQLVPWFSHSTTQTTLVGCLSICVIWPAWKKASVHSEFEGGWFVIRRTQRHFSALAIDHAHEQNNKCVKGDGGAIGLTENASQLLRWMVAEPQVASFNAEFEVCHDSLKASQTKGHDVHHHEQEKST